MSASALAEFFHDLESVGVFGDLSGRSVNREARDTKGILTEKILGGCFEENRAGLVGGRFFRRGLPGWYRSDFGR
jgi:hypothetical protein